MLPAARDAQIDFVRLAAEEPSSLYFEDFLCDGYDAWPATYRERFPGLATWCGVAGLKLTLLKLAEAPSDWQAVVASRSLPLLRLGARRLFHRCRRVLTTDLSWPTYRAAIVERAGHVGADVEVAPLRQQILRDGWNGADVATFLGEEFVRRQCDGLFVPVVDHLGVQLPIGRIVAAIQAVAKLHFVLLDAAQALCHVPLGDALRYADFVVAGSHKWMGAYLPTGIAFLRCGSAPLSNRRSFANHQRQFRRCDPLVAFTEEIASGQPAGVSETANLAGLFACAAAARVQESRRPWAEVDASGTFEERLKQVPLDDSWRQQVHAPDLQSRIRLFRFAGPGGDQLTAANVRRQWHIAGCIVTGYDGGVARLSPPIVGTVPGLAVGAGPPIPKVAYWEGSELWTH